MASKLKKMLKKSPVYELYSDLKVYKDYSNKYGIGLKTAFLEANPLKYDIPLILKKAKINNVGAGDFFYSIDHSVVVKTKKL